MPKQLRSDKRSKGQAASSRGKPCDAGRGTDALLPFWSSSLLVPGLETTFAEVTPDF
jgi:hypothetical protein